ELQPIGGVGAMSRTCSTAIARGAGRKTNASPRAMTSATVRTRITAYLPNPEISSWAAEITAAPGGPDSQHGGVAASDRNIDRPLRQPRAVGVQVSHGIPRRASQPDP